MTERHQKITFDEMRKSGATGVLICCNACGRHVERDGAAWPDDVRLSDIVPLFVCTVCGRRGAEIRPNFPHAQMGTDYK
jgi:hypothetical protein